jgi:oligopeptide/dipeptide ABC transporter ATP-binding protein
MEGSKHLNIENLKISFPYGENNIQVIRGVNLYINEHEIIGILGESGSGKTVTASSIIGLSKFDGGIIDCGQIIYEDMDLLKLSEKQLRNIRGKEISYIFQDSTASLNPYLKIAKQIEEVQKVHKSKVSKKLIIDLLEEIGLENAHVILDMYPSQLSGGQCQRIAIAMALLGNSKIIIADEPTSSVDASMQGIILNLFRKINKKFGVSLILITHNFEIVKDICSRVVVMYGGLVMEQGITTEVMGNPLHPYSKELINCTKSMSDNDEILYTLEGKAPSPQEFRDECPFLNRCSIRNKSCENGIPDIKVFGNGREVRCIRI